MSFRLQRKVQLWPVMARKLQGEARTAALKELQGWTEVKLRAHPF